MSRLPAAVLLAAHARRMRRRDRASTILCPAALCCHCPVCWPGPVCSAARGGIRRTHVRHPWTGLRLALASPVRLGLVAPAIRLASPLGSVLRTAGSHTETGPRRSGTAASGISGDNPTGRGVGRCSCPVHVIPSGHGQTPAATSSRSKPRPRTTKPSLRYPLALRFDGEKHHHRADKTMARIVAAHLNRHLQQSGLVVMKRPPAGQPSIGARPGWPGPERD